MLIFIVLNIIIPFQLSSTFNFYLKGHLMARPLRVEYPGAYYHVINRGNAGENIFIDERDREIFLEYLAKGTERFITKIHTYCLMSNHYHLLIETPRANLRVAIQWLNVSYSVSKAEGHILVKQRVTS